jgi:hypothetical protein
MLISIIALALAVTAQPDSAPVRIWKTGNDILADCSSTSDAVRFACMGYIMGVSDTIATEGGLTQPIALPEGSTPVQLKDVVISYLTQHPEKRHLTAAALVYGALTGAFGIRH